MPVTWDTATKVEILLRFGTYFCALGRGARRYDKWVPMPDEGAADFPTRITS